jgi:hypothetical protein
MAAGFRRISEEPGKFAKFFNDYQDRILFGADMVLTDDPARGQHYIEEMLTCYQELLEKRRFTCDRVTSFYEQKLTEAHGSYDNCMSKESEYCKGLQKKSLVYQQRLGEVENLNGLGLSDSVINKVYWENAARFMDAK